MRASRTLAVVGALLIAATGCAIHLDGGEPDRVDDAIRAAAAEVHLHRSLMSGADTMDGVRIEVARHVGEMDDRLRDLRRRVADRDCPDDDGLDALADMIDAVAAREVTYQREMEVAHGAGAARGVCAAYGADMDALLGRTMIGWFSLSCSIDG